MSVVKSVASIQARLVELGFLNGPVDGRSGPQTKAAIKAAQRWHGLKPDGIVGPLTTAALWPGKLAERGAVAVPDVPKNGSQNWPRQADVPKFYGARGGDQAMLELPYAMRIAWDLRQTVKRISVHRKVHDSAARAFARIADTYSAPERKALGLDLFGGCLNVRKMRGGSAWSMHSWGIAIDFDPARNGLNSKKAPGPRHARLADVDALPFWRCWEDEGWLSLGRARDYDWMHVQAARL